MGECELSSTCDFFKEAKNMRSLVNAVREAFCRNGNSCCCARYMVFKELGKEGVPRDLFPGQFHRAKMIITGSKS